jgi:hypothetical protein
VNRHLLLSIHGCLTPNNPSEYRQIGPGGLVHSLIALILILSIKPFSGRKSAKCCLDCVTFPYLHVDVHQQVERVTVMPTFIACDARTELPSKEAMKPRGLGDFVRDVPAKGLIRRRFKQRVGILFASLCIYL